jgi:hypothetical protein
VNGGSAPVTGFHSTIESPDSVSRVAPPTKTMIAINSAIENSHQRTARFSGVRGAEMEIMREA